MAGALVTHPCMPPNRSPAMRTQDPRRPAANSLRHGCHLLNLVLATCLAGGLACASDDTGLAPASCNGVGCTCGPENSCACTAGTDCRTTCSVAGCALRCETGAKCNATSEGPTLLTCNDSSECKGNGGDGSMISCVSASKCELKAGARSSAICSSTANCKLNLGAGSTVSCMDGSTCEVKCLGDCAVTCGPLATCKLNCETDNVAATTCADGRRVCGHC